MLDEFKRIAHNRKGFNEQVGRYFVNMQGNRRTLHITECPKCQRSTYAYEFITFDTLDEVAKFEDEHRDDTPFIRCRNCF